MLPKKLKRTEMDPNAEMAKHDTAYHRPEEIPCDANEERLLAERLAGQHKMMGGSSVNVDLLDRIDKADWPEGACVDTEPSILPE
jgi:hypothetical protein